MAVKARTVQRTVYMAIAFLGAEDFTLICTLMVPSIILPVGTVVFKLLIMVVFMNRNMSVRLQCWLEIQYVIVNDAFYIRESLERKH